MIPLLVGAALAAGVHGGIPVRGVPGIGEPSFQTPATGWTAAVEGGWVRVYVGLTEAAGEDWYGRTLQTLGVPPAELAPFAPGIDAAHGDGDTLVAFRDGNVAVLVRTSTGARAVAEALHAAIVEDTAGPKAPTIRASAGTWEVDAPSAVHISFTGGRGVPFKRGVFTEPPRQIVVWDALGRATVLTP